MFSANKLSNNNEMKRMKFEYKGVKLQIWRSHYDDGHTALILVDLFNMSYLATLTVCTPGFNFPSDELAIKAWSENEEIAEICFQTGVFEDTGKRGANEKVTVEFWKMKKPYSFDLFPMIKYELLNVE